MKMKPIPLEADTEYTVEQNALDFDIQPIEPDAGDVLTLIFENGAKLHVRAPRGWTLEIDTSANPH